MTAMSSPPSKPWYLEPWPWFLISLPAAAVVAGLATVWIAATNKDGLVVGDYYNAGLAINQTLARDDRARSLGLRATLRSADGTLALALGGQLAAYPAELTLTLAHPTRPGMDQTLRLSHAGSGQYRSAMPAMPDGKWHAQLADDAGSWRLSGVLHTPFSKPATLTAGTESTVQ
jgi:hypothetical protein